jgi:hypothetical protein
MIYAVAGALTNRFSVWYLDFWDPKFHDRAGNVAVADQALPIFVGLATFSFLLGFAVSMTGLGSVRSLVAALAGASCGLIAGFCIVAEPALRKLGVPDGFSFAVGLLSFWGAPALTAIVMFRFLANQHEFERSNKPLQPTSGGDF